MKIPRSRKKISLIVAAVIVVIAVIGLSVFLVSRGPSNTPRYQTILPGDKTIEQLGDWERVSPPNSDPVFAYVDTIDSVSISVSQQPVPASFNGSVDQKVADLAKSYSATKQISAGDTKVYIGTSSKGPQSTIFVKNKVLVLIKSQNKIDDKSWATYITSLN